MKNERLEKLLNFLNSGSTDPFIKYAIATEYVKLKQYESAIPYYEDLVTNNPNYVGTYYHFGKLLEEIGDTEKAISIYEKGMEIAKKANDMHAYSELQGVYLGATGFDPDDDDF